jgi:hypothetical protein
MIVTVLSYIENSVKSTGFCTIASSDIAINSTPGSTHALKNPQTTLPELLDQQTDSGELN